MMPKLTLLEQFRSLLPTLFTIYTPSFLLLAGAGLQRRIPVSHLVSDPTAIAQAPFYLGIISNIGVLIWCASASICLFCAVVSKNTVNERWHPFLLISGLITLVLLTDDFFLLHEKFYPNYLSISEEIVLSTYATITLLYLTTFRKTILKTNFLLILLAFIFFGISISIDKEVVPLLTGLSDRQIGFLLEDGAKFLGIVSWSAYLINICLQVMRGRAVKN